MFTHLLELLSAIVQIGSFIRQGSGCRFRDEWATRVAISQLRAEHYTARAALHGPRTGSGGRTLRYVTTNTTFTRTSSASVASRARSAKSRRQCDVSILNAIAIELHIGLSAGR